MLVILLAAGLGTRMGALTAHVPKALVAVQGGASILALNFQSFRRSRAAAELLVVGGHGWDSLADFVQAQAAGALKARAVYNAQYATAGPLRSIDVALAVLTKDPEVLAIANGDTLYSSDLIHSAEVRSSPGVTLVASRVDQAEPDDMRVEQGSGLLRAVKRPDGQGPATVSAGFMVIRGPAAIAALRSLVTTLLQEETATGKQKTWHSLLEGFQRRGVPAALLMTGRGSWNEFDSNANVRDYKPPEPRPAIANQMGQKRRSARARSSGRP